MYSLVSSNTVGGKSGACSKLLPDTDAVEICSNFAPFSLAKAIMFLVPSTLTS
jgi:hypothetical protein